MQYFELITVILVVAVGTFFWLRASRKANRLPAPPLWFTHVAQRLGLLAEYKVKKAKWGLVLKGSRGGTSFNIGAFPSQNPEDLYISVRRKTANMDLQWLLYPKQAAKNVPNSDLPSLSFGNEVLDSFFVLKSNGTAAAVLALFDKPEAQAVLTQLQNYTLHDWVIGIHEDTIYYKEAFRNASQGNSRVDHLMDMLDFLLLLGVEQLIADGGE